MSLCICSLHTQFLTISICAEAKGIQDSKFEIQDKQTEWGIKIQNSRFKIQDVGKIQDVDEIQGLEIKSGGRYEI